MATLTKAKKEKKKKIIKEKQLTQTQEFKKEPYTIETSRDNTSLCEDVKLFKTTDFPFMTFPFEYFNPMQSGIVEKIINTDNNFIVLSPTASGKTVVFEMLASKIISAGKKAIYLSPLKALSNEKLQDWTDERHFFSKYKVCIMTGDQEKTDAKMKEMNNADIIVMTSEMLDSCRRNNKDDDNWLSKTGALLIDESHLISEKTRGDKLESAIMGFTKFNPDCQLMLSTATAPNSHEFSEWIESITNKKTILYESNYRPCSLNRHFVRFPGTTYQGEESLRIKISLDLMMQYPDDLFLIFCASKKFQKTIADVVSRHGISCEFYNADLSYSERTRIYNEFNEKKFRCLISTPGLAWGVNMPARRVIIAHNKFGRIDDVTTATLNQMAGRAGRPKYDTEGDVYFLLPERDYGDVVARVKEGENISSCMTGVMIDFHAIAEIKNGYIKTPEDFFEWYKRSFAYSQKNKMSKLMADSMFERLTDIKMIKKLESNDYVATPTGIVTAMMYLIPEDVNCWKMNFGTFFKQEHKVETKREKDWLIAGAFVNIKSNYDLKKWIDRDIGAYFKKLCGFNVHDAQTYLQMIHYFAMNDCEFPDYMINEVMTVRRDIQRIISALSQIDLRTRLWGKSGFWKMLAMRFKYGVPESRTELCSIPGIGAAYSKKLHLAGIKTISDVMYNTHILEDILGKATSDKVKKGLGIYSDLKEQEQYLNNELGI